MPVTAIKKAILKVGAKGISPEQLQELVDWVVTHSPVGSDIARAVDVSVNLEVV